MYGVIAFIGELCDDVGAISDISVIPGAAYKGINPSTTVKRVVASITVECVIPSAASHNIVACKVGCTGNIVE